MSAPLPQPPINTPFFDAKSGAVNPIWANYLLSIATAVTTNTAPIDAAYWVSTANTTLTNDVDLGMLLSGYLKQVTVAGTATPSTTPTIPTSDLNGVLQAAQFPALTGAVLTSSGSLATTLTVQTVSGTYTPTLTSVANITASTAFACQYLRVGNVVTVSGKLALTPTAATTFTQLGVSLPIASTFTAAEQCGGTAAAIGVAGYSAGVLADAVNHRAELDFTTAADVANRAWWFTFSYLVV